MAEPSFSQPTPSIPLPAPRSSAGGG